MGWSYNEYIDAPALFIDVIKLKMNAEARLAEEKKPG